MTLDELQCAWADLLEWREAQLRARTLPAPSGRAVGLAAYFAAYRQMAATVGGPLLAQHAAVTAWEQAGVDLSTDDRERLYQLVDGWIADREGR
jgi:hypothetical protein